MPPEPDAVERTTLVGALAGLGASAEAGADDLLDLFPVAGDREAQRAVDSYLEQVADLLREVQATALELTATLQVVGRGGRTTSTSMDAHGADTQPGRTR